LPFRKWKALRGSLVGTFRPGLFPRVAKAPPVGGREGFSKMTHEISVRAMTRGDLGGVGRVLDSSGLFPSEMLGPMAEPFLGGGAAHIWLVALCDGEAAGFVYCEPERMTDGTHNMLALAVAAERQRSGVGAALVARLEDALREIGARLLLVESSTDPDQDGARAFYANAGFAEEARVRDFYADGQTKVIFSKRL
jgi:GNAT superfamily N-acetyltransferase